jgi:hypothetical protein
MCSDQDEEQNDSILFFDVMTRLNECRGDGFGYQKKKPGMGGMRCMK